MSDENEIVEDRAAPTPQPTHTLTIPEVVARFADAGVPRAARTIQTYCKTGTLDCITVPGALGPKYLINEQSVDDRIQEFVQMRDLLAASTFGGNGAGHSALKRAPTRLSAQERADDGVDEVPSGGRAEIQKLKEEVLSLTIEVRARDGFINMLQTEKKDQFERLWTYTTKIAEQGREIGNLEARLALVAPRESYPHETPKAEGGGGV